MRERNLQGVVRWMTRSGVVAGFLPPDVALPLISSGWKMATACACAVLDASAGQLARNAAMGAVP
ncbi:MAG TPA: hypothetical protein VLH79_09475 [Chthonomonadales bacterium]|nr:hypothetical protein [Chthonomonadales bacterium]